MTLHSEDFTTQTSCMGRPEPLLAEHAALSDRIERYWSQRASSYGAIRSKEWHSHKKSLWLAEIQAHLPTTGPLRVLDVGTGTGFFAILLASQGHDVCGVDMCADMLLEGERLAAQAQCRVHFQVMDACRLEFADDSFDLVISRNLTWTLPDAAAAYAEWRRVLRPGGTLLNFDADYGAASFVQQDYASWMQQHQGMDHELTEECESIRRSLPLSAQVRPQWDKEILDSLGFTQCRVDTGVSARIFAVQDDTYNPFPMFALAACKC